MNTTITRRLGAVLAASAVAAVLLSGCSAPSSSGTKESAIDLSKVTLTIGQQGSETEAIFKASKAFDDAPYKVDYATFSSPAETLTALANGNVDVGNNLAQWTATQGAAAASPAWTSATAPYKNILVNAPTDNPDFDRFAVVASAKSGITKLSQAKGKKWGFLPGTSTNLLAAKALQKLGWTFKDIQPVSLDATNQAIALQTGLVDVIFNPIDNLGAAINGGAKVLGSARDYDLKVYTGYLANSRDLKDPAKNAALKDLVGRIIDAQNWSVTHPAEAQAALAKYRKLTPALAKTAWDYTRVVPTVPDAKIADYSQGLADTAVTFGLLKNKVDAKVLLDDEFASTITARLKKDDYAKHFAASYKSN